MSSSVPSVSSPLPTLVQHDPTLLPFAEVVRTRQERYTTLRQQLEPLGGLLGTISQGHHYFGLNTTDDGTIVYREWAPAAQALFLIGDFNGWDRHTHPLQRDDFGVWSCTLPPETLSVGSRLKVHVVGADGAAHDRIPAYIRCAVQDPITHDFVGEFWPAPTVRPKHHPLAHPQNGLRIYEAHVGMAQETAGVGSFREFTERILPKIVALGYDAVQLMAIQEHPYYGSFGYHVSSFYGVSSRFGTPDDLRELIAEAHRLGLVVLMDLVHSHAVKNLNEGLSKFDGTGFQYFHGGPRGYHPAWDSLCFDYSRFEVQRFLLSNVRYWLEEYGFDGFRFDGVTSMLYLDHGLAREFTGYPDYFGENVDTEALLYLQLANDLAHAVLPSAITIAEDVSGMPGLARPTSEGGVGFDFRLAMGVPDFWIKLVKERLDEDWSVGEIWGTLLNRRRDEKHIGYAESHDQSIVGDQTLAFRLMGALMYTEMAKGRSNVVVDRGVALHKLIRFLTYSLAGEGWLCFMGNEFGHPEWVDFPRAGNDWSYAYARRQWSLAESPFLRYEGLLAFDAALMRLPLETENGPELLLLHEDDQLLVWRRGENVYAVNLHPTRSQTDLRLPVPTPTDYVRILDTDQEIFSGHGRITGTQAYIWQPVPLGGCRQSILTYLPSRCGIVVAPSRK